MRLLTFVFFAAAACHDCWGFSAPTRSSVMRAHARGNKRMRNTCLQQKERFFTTSSLFSSKTNGDGTGRRKLMNSTRQQQQQEHFLCLTPPLFSKASSEAGETDSGVQSRYIPLDFEPDDGFYPERSNLDAPAILNFVIPTLTPIVAYFTYNLLAGTLDQVIDYIASNTWYAVDGGAYQARVIAPAVNGVVVPSIAILFATLTSTTITTLRARQVDIRRAINTEAGELRAVECLLEAFPQGNMKDRCRDYLIQYTSRIISESDRSWATAVNPRRSMDSELNALMNVLNRNRFDDEECPIDAGVPSHVLSEVFSSVSKLRDQRHLRVTALQSTYPALHYVILFVLAFSICTAFLIETDQELLQFLNDVQLKILWSILNGTFVSCFVVFADLQAPFSGTYKISACVEQLHTIRLQLKAAVQLEEMLAMERESRAKDQQRKKSKSKQRRSRLQKQTNSTAVVSGDLAA